MNFFNLLQSLDELLYEVMSWLVFYPITLWRTLVHPLQDDGLFGRASSGDAERPAIYRYARARRLFLLLTLIHQPRRSSSSLVGHDAVVAQQGRTVGAGQQQHRA